MDRMKKEDSEEPARPQTKSMAKSRSGQTRRGTKPKTTVSSDSKCNAEMTSPRDKTVLGTLAVTTPSLKSEEGQKSGQATDDQSTSGESREIKGSRGQNMAADGQTNKALTFEKTTESRKSKKGRRTELAEIKSGKTEKDGEAELAKLKKRDTVEPRQRKKDEKVTSDDDALTGVGDGDDDPVSSICRTLTRLAVSDNVRRPLLPLGSFTYPGPSTAWPASCVLTLSEARTLESLTQDQSASPLWKEARRFRLTASMFGSVVKRRKAVNEGFLDRLRGKGQWTGNQYTRAGLANEVAVVDKYCSGRSAFTFPVGFCVNPSVPVIGASPDRVVFDQADGEFGLLEIKTMAKAKELNWSVLQTVEAKKGGCCLKKDADGTLHLDTNHDYYFQVQGQLGITRLPWCDFFVDAGKDFFCQRIHYDERFFDKMIQKLTSFFLEHLAEE